MAIDDVEEKLRKQPEGDDNKKVTFIAIFAALVLLAIGEIYALNSLGDLGRSMQEQQAAMKKDLTAQLTQRLSALEQSNARVLDDMRQEVEDTAKRGGATRADLHRARLLVGKIQAEQTRDSQEVKAELAQKADQDQVGALSGAVTSTRSDLEDTQKALEATRSDLGMARSQFGTLIARNHDDIVYLRKMGQRNYFEFTVWKNRPVKVAGVGLVLKKANVHHHRFNLNLIADDMTIEKKNRTIDEPIFFSVSGSKSFYELVINKVQSGQVKGYISTPKGATEVAAR
jgi:hypothetical protein